MATSRKAPVAPQQVELTVEKMTKGIARLQRIIAEVKEFDPSKVTKRWGSEQKALETTIDGALSSVFGHGTVEYNRYRRATGLDHGGIIMSRGGGYGGPSEEAIAQKNITEGKEESIKILEQAVRWLQDEVADSSETGSTQTGEPTSSKVLSRKVFIVHGHDEGALQAVARYVEKIGFEAIILREQANRGGTIIEKIEANGDVGFAIVLLTPDDVGGKLNEEQRPRARQNVLLELGYFIGRLGRQNVCTLARADLEIPTDFAGVVWEQLDDAGAWKRSLARELDAAGFEIDWNKVMR